MTDRRHPDELISASLSGELGFEERAELDAHLGSCPRCRAMRTEFLEQRRLLGGMRRESAPPTLAPRVQAAIASGATAGTPWWRRPGRLALVGASAAVLVLGVTAGLAIRGGGLDGEPVGRGPTPTPVATTTTAVLTASPVTSPSAAPLPTATLASTPAATEPPVASPTPAATAPATPLPTPDTPLDPGSVAFLELSGETDTQVLTVREPTLHDGMPTDLDSAEVITEPSRWSGPPMVAELSPDGEWLAYQTPHGQSGITDVWAVRLSDGETLSLGETISDTPFTERMAWSHDGHRLAFTLAPPDKLGTQDVWIFDSETGDVFQLVETGNSYAASFQNSDQLWVSLADRRPASYRLTLTGAGPTGSTVTDLEHFTVAEGVFQPLFSPDGRRVIFWRGTMDQPESASWRFSEGGMPYLAETRDDGDLPEWDDAEQLFPDLQPRRDAFAFASIAWSFNSDDFAVWNAVWTGEPIPTDQTERGEFPDPTLIYVGELSSGQFISDYPYLDVVSQRDEGAVVRDVEFSPGPEGSIGQTWITLQLPIGGDMQTPIAVLEVTPALPSGYEPAEARPGVWRGPAVYLGEPRDGESP